MSADYRPVDLRWRVADRLYQTGYLAGETELQWRTPACVEVRTATSVPLSAIHDALAPAFAVTLKEGLRPYLEVREMP
jgi:hypothetical protein